MKRFVPPYLVVVCRSFIDLLKHWVQKYRCGAVWLNIKVRGSMQAFCSATASSDAEGDCRLKLTRRLFFATLHSSLSAAFCARAVRSPLLMRHFSGRECRDPILWTGHEARTDPTYWKCVGCWLALALA